MSTRTNSRTKTGASGNLSRTPVTRPGRDPGGPTRAATTIAFASPATITDSGNGLAVFRPGTALRIVGAVNARRWIVTTSSAGSLTVTPALVQTAAAGPLVVIAAEE